jgi:SAM domain (Sterile alpha motif)
MELPSEPLPPRTDVRKGAHIPIPSYSGCHSNPTPPDAKDWRVEDVARWLETRGFDRDVCHTFTGVFLLRLVQLMHIDHVQADHKITGSVLLKLNVDILKVELGISAYGTRAAIEEAVYELRQEGEYEWLVMNATCFFICPPRLTFTGSMRKHALSSRSTGRKAA